MTSQLQELLKASQELQIALVARDTDAIMAAVARQEKSTDACLKAHTARSASPVGEGAEPVTGNTSPHTIAEDQALAAGIRRIQQTNQRIAGGFLKVIDRTLAVLGAGTSRHSVTYGADGWSRSSMAPVLVHQLG